MNAAGVARTRTWFRRQRLWLIGCLLTAPIVLLWPARDAWRSYSRWRPLLATDVAPGAGAPFGGAEWRLGSVEILDPADLHLQRAPPANAVVLVAHFTMTPAADADRKLLASCEGRISDRDGRHWDERPLELSGLRLEEPRGCVADFSETAEIRSAPPGAPWHFAHAYLVPADVAAGTTPEIILPKLQPHFLRFQRR